MTSLLRCFFWDWSQKIFIRYLSIENAAKNNHCTLESCSGEGQFVMIKIHSDLIWNSESPYSAKSDRSSENAKDETWSHPWGISGHIHQAWRRQKEWHETKTCGCSLFFFTPGVVLWVNKYSLQKHSGFRSDCTLLLNQFTGVRINYCFHFYSIYCTLLSEIKKEEKTAV